MEKFDDIFYFQCGYMFKQNIVLCIVLQKLLLLLFVLPHLVLCSNLFENYTWVDLDNSFTAMGILNRGKQQKLNNNNNNNNNNPQGNSKPHTIYSIWSIEDLQHKHIDKLHNANNIFFIKNTNSSLQFDQQSKSWIEICKKNAKDKTFIQTLDKWIPISSCLESIHGSGAQISRVVSFHIAANMDTGVGVATNFPPIAVIANAGLNLALGVRVGISNLVTVSFSCTINTGEIAQFFIKPMYVVIPDLKTIMYKLKKGRLHKVKVQNINSFRMLNAETPEHQCWVSKDVNDLQCTTQDVDKIDIDL